MSGLVFCSSYLRERKKSRRNGNLVYLGDWKWVLREFTESNALAWLGQREDVCFSLSLFGVSSQGHLNGSFQLTKVTENRYIISLVATDQAG